MPLLSIKNLRAGYGPSEVLHGINLHVEAGEVVTLIGPNGAGKSTVLNSVVRLCDVSDGTIKFNDKNIRDLPTHALLRLGIGFVPQGRLVFPSLTVEENLEMGGYVLDNRSAVQAALENVFTHLPQLKERSNVPAGDLSGGQQQQVAIGRALMLRPKLLMLDEPSLGLSPIMMREIYEKLDALNKEGVSLLIVEQNVKLGLSIANRGYLLANGEIRHVGSPQELLKPELMHAAFLGVTQPSGDSPH